jgi:two-component system, NtrC family, response regulator AtoC
MPSPLVGRLDDDPPGHADGVRTSAMNDSHREPSAAGRGARILAVDDDPLFLAMLTEVLGVLGYAVVTAQNAGDAFMLVAVAPPDVVLLDVGMPGIDGVTALRRIRARHPELPVIMCTANVDVARDTLERAAFDYVAKPINFDRLAGVIEAALAHRG